MGESAGLVLILLACLPLLLYRISLESSLWCDEIWSVMLANNPLPGIIDLTTADAHPPGYYILLKIWNKLPRLVGHDPGVFWGRLLGVVAWVGMVAMAWFGCRRVAGRSIGALMALCVAVGTQAAISARNMRGYALALPALFLCFILLWVAYERAAKSSRTEDRADENIWAAYGLCAALALWSNLLSALVLLLLGLQWIGLTIRIGDKRAKRRFLIGGALAQGAAAVSFAPWLAQIPRNVSYLGAASHDWMTEPSMANLLKVFTLWYPIGRAAGPVVETQSLEILRWVGILSAVIPALLLLLACLLASPKPIRRQSGHGVSETDPRSPKPDKALGRLGFSGLATAAFFVLALWIMHRLGWAQVFHGPRYPCLTAGMWAVGLSGLAAWSMRRLGYSRHLAWLVMLPWLLGSMIGQVIEVREEARGGLAAVIDRPDSHLPRPDGTVYVYPSELISYYRASLSPFQVERIEAIAEVPAGTDRVYLLQLNPWSQLRRERDTVIVMQVTSGKLSDKLGDYRFPPWAPIHDFYRSLVLDGFGHEQARGLFNEGFATAELELPLETVVAVHPRKLRMGEGWHTLEAGAKRGAFRWSSSPNPRIRMGDILEPGAYDLHIQGLRNPHPTKETTLRFRFRGQPEQYELTLPPEWFSLSVPVEVGQVLRGPVLELEHPVYRISEYQLATGDDRRVGFLFHSLWLTPRGTGPGTTPRMGQGSGD